MELRETLAKFFRGNVECHAVGAIGRDAMARPGVRLAILAAGLVAGLMSMSGAAHAGTDFELKTGGIVVSGGGAPSGGMTVHMPRQKFGEPTSQIQVARMACADGTVTVIGNQLVCGGKAVVPKVGESDFGNRNLASLRAARDGAKGWQAR